MKLVARDGTEYGLEQGETTIGRIEQSDITLHDPRVSRRHAIIHVEGDRCSIEDLGSTNWTMVNGERIKGKRELQDWDEVVFADTRLIFRRGAVTEGREAPPQEPVEAAEQIKTAALTNEGRSERYEYRENDNVGTRVEDANLANRYWTAQQKTGRTPGFIHYRFDTGYSAQMALLDIPFIHQAVDSKKPISTVPVTYGVYTSGPESYDLVLWGDVLGRDVFTRANEICQRHGGTLVNQHDPADGTATVTVPERQGEVGGGQGGSSVATAKEAVTFVRTDRRPGSMGVEYVYHIYTGPDEATARTFLEQNPVSEIYVYIIVETPTGNFGRDIQGIFAE